MKKILIYLFLLHPCLVLSMPNERLKPGLNYLTIEQVGQKQRKVVIELPLMVDSNIKYPVVFGFHGAGGHEGAYNRRLAPYVNQFQVITVSILGTNDNRYGPATWNFSTQAKTSADDVSLVLHLIERLDSQSLIDRERIYATGASAGGLFSYYLGIKTNVFAAIAPTKCGMVRQEHKPSSIHRALSLFQVIGDQDKSFHGSDGPISMYSAQERIKLWRTVKNCASKPMVLREPGVSTDMIYSCPGSTEVRLLTLDGVGHRLGKYWTELTDRMIMMFFLRDVRLSP